MPETDLVMKRILLSLLCIVLFTFAHAEEVGQDVVHRIKTEAISMLTIDVACVSHSEQGTESIEVGKLADLAVLDRNPFDIIAAEISETQVLLTLIWREEVHGSLAGF